MLLIINSTEGRVPKYWRPPFGDVDVRVRDIAKEVCISFIHYLIFFKTFIRIYILILLFILRF